MHKPYKLVYVQHVPADNLTLYPPSACYRDDPLSPPLISQSWKRIQQLFKEFST